MTFRDAKTEIAGYHAHIYYSPETRETASLLRWKMEEKFEVRLGRWHDVPVGPHPTAMYQVAFKPAEFDRLVPWLMINRQELDIFIHPETGDDLRDHRDDALWLGNKLSLKLECFKPQQSSA